MSRRKTGAQLDREIKMALASLGEERDAIRVYGQRRAKSRDSGLRDSLAHARREERQHARMFVRDVKRLRARR